MALLPISCEKAVENLVTETIEVREIDLPVSVAEDGVTHWVAIRLDSDGTMTWQMRSERGEGGLRDLEMELDRWINPELDGGEIGARIMVDPQSAQGDVVHLLEVLTLKGVEIVTFTEVNPVAP
ncbi:hypothetical protein [Haloferula sp.]|uniref:hypothetical protein n=1 Tax=Haloferula sp. TaxID=2497595 RepID=UPI00329EDD81